MHSYFTAGHTLYQEFHISYDDFQRSLINNLLLQPDGITFCDHFLNGPYVARHMSESPRADSWIESGLRSGLIVPWMKSEDETVVGLLERQLEYGARAIHPKAGYFASRLDEVPWASRRIYKRRYGRAFAARLQRVMVPEIPHLTSGTEIHDVADLSEFWNRPHVRDMRTRDIDTALELTIRSGNDGLQLAKLIQAISMRMCGTTGDSSDTVQTLLDRLSGKPLIQNDARRFFKIACDTFNVSMAQCVESAPNSPTPDHDFVTIQADLWQEWHDEWRNEAESIVVSAQWPRFETLAKLSGDQLLIAREKGADFHSAFRRWLGEPNAEHSEVLLTHLVTYGEELVREYERSEKKAYLRVLSSNISGSLRTATATFAGGIVVAAMKPDLIGELLPITAGALGVLSVDMFLANFPPFLSRDSSKKIHLRLDSDVVVSP